MKFLSSEWLLFIPVLVVGAYFLRALEIKRNKNLETILHSRLWKTVLPSYRKEGRRRKLRWWVLGTFFLIVSLAGPYWGQKETLVKSDGMDWVVVLDVSNSMLVKDVVPSRLKRAKFLIRTLMEELKEDRFGLVAFAGRSVVSVPLTRDFEYFNEVLDQTDTESVMLQGTDLGLAIATASAALERGAVEFGDPQARQNGILVVTDGEDFGQRIREAVGRNQLQGVQFVLVGIGTPEGGPIPIYDRVGVERGQKRDANGETVVASFNPEPLKTLSELTKSAYFHYKGESRVRDAILSEMKNAEGNGVQSERRIQPIHRYQWVLALSVICFLIEMSLSLTFRKAAMVLILSGCFSYKGYASELEAIFRNNQAVDSIQAGRISEGLDKIGEASLANPDLPEILHNQGVAQLKSKRFQESARSFSEASKMFQSKNDLESAVESKVLEAESYEKAGNSERSVQSLLKALSLSKEAGDEELEKEVRQRLIKNQQQQAQGGGGEGDPDAEQDSENNGDQEDKKRGSSQEESDKQKESHRFQDEDSRTLMRSLADQQKEIRKRFENRHSKKQGRSGSPQGKDW